MAAHTLLASTVVDRPIDEVFEFFSNAENLERITPSSLGFHIITPRPIRMGVGTLIDYRLSLRGIPLRWRSEIVVWEPPHRFADRQVRGPYKEFYHTHTFSTAEGGGTLIEDEVRYRLPLEPFGDLMQWLVARDLKQIFDHRERAIKEIFS